MTARSSFNDRLRLVEDAQERSEREHLRTVEELRRTTEQTEALITDKRSTDRVLRDTEKAVLALDRRVTSLAAHYAESLSVMRDMADEMKAQRAALEALGSGLASTRTAASEAKSKASGAHRLALQAEARASKSEEQIRAELAAARAETDRRIAVAVANPPAGDELRELRAEFLKAAKPWAPRLVAGVALVILAALAAAAAYFQSCGG
jgi:chromosome segregation ATPase